MRCLSCNALCVLMSKSSPPLPQFSVAGEKVEPLLWLWLLLWLLPAPNGGTYALVANSSLAFKSYSSSFLSARFWRCCRQELP